MTLLGFRQLVESKSKRFKNSFISTFDKKLLETVKHSYYLQNNKITKIQREINHDQFHDFIGSSLERKSSLNFGTPLMKIECVF